MTQTHMPGRTTIQQLSPPETPPMSGQLGKSLPQDWNLSSGQLSGYRTRPLAQTAASSSSHIDSSRSSQSFTGSVSYIGDLNYVPSSGRAPRSHPDDSDGSAHSLPEGHIMIDSIGISSVAPGDVGNTTNAAAVSDDEQDYDEVEGGSDGDQMEDRQSIRTGTQQPRRKMKRFRLTHQQTRYLMAEFTRDAHPDATHREKLASDIPGLSPRQVQVWFQNRRAKLKRMTAEDRESMMSSRALPDNFAHPLTYSSLQSPSNNPDSGRFNGPQPLSVNVPVREVNRASITTSPTTMTPALQSFSFAASPHSAEIRSPVSGGGQYGPFGYRSLGTRPMASPGYQSTTSVTAMVDNLPTMGRHRHMSLDSHAHGVGDATHLYSGPPVGNGDSHERRFSVSNGRELAPIGPGYTVNGVSRALSDYQRGTQAVYGPSASFPSYFDYSSGTTYVTPFLPAMEPGHLGMPPPSHFTANRAEPRRDEPSPTRGS